MKTGTLQFQNQGYGNLWPSCGEQGKPVKTIMVESLLTEEAKSKTAKRDNFLFCQTANCDVLYFHRDGDEVFSRYEVRVRIGQK